MRIFKLQIPFLQFSFRSERNSYYYLEIYENLTELFQVTQQHVINKGLGKTHIQNSSVEQFTWSEIVL